VEVATVARVAEIEVDTKAAAKVVGTRAVADIEVDAKAAAKVAATRAAAEVEAATAGFGAHIKSRCTADPGR
jgi:hypothetical protein